MKDSLVQQCLDILKREDIKNEFKMLLKPVIDFILYEINPLYLYNGIFSILDFYNDFSNTYNSNYVITQ